MAFLSKIGGFLARKLEKQAVGMALAVGVELADERLKEVKQELLEKVRDHPLCQELDSLTTPSQFVDSKSGTATLYGYLGFEGGRNPVAELIAFLDQHIKIKEDTKRKFIFFGKKTVRSLSLPSKSDMSADPTLRTEWSSTAWPILVEDGISGAAGASHFIQVYSKESRSGLGIQVSGITRPDMSPVPFLSVIFRELKESLV